MNNNQTAFDIDELYFKANNDMAVILNINANFQSALSQQFI